ncbi:MAG: T9SS type A sorting domain-containing protein [Tannerella sp.]|jgi:hypothetical protein|nr:T9SS type A sorting domain-containing protein [Tannerella sp.]
MNGKITFLRMVLTGMFLACSAYVMSFPVAKPIFDSVYYYLKIDTSGVDLGYLGIRSTDAVSVNPDDGSDSVMWRIIAANDIPDYIAAGNEYRFVNVATADTLRFMPITTEFPDTVAAINDAGVLSYWFDLIFNEGEGNKFKTKHKGAESAEYTYHLTMSVDGTVMLSLTDTSSLSLPELPLSVQTQLNFTVERVKRLPDPNKYYRLKVDTAGVPDVAPLGYLSADTVIRRDSLAVYRMWKGDLSLWKPVVDTIVFDTTYYRISNKATESILAFDIKSPSGGDTIAYMSQSGELNRWMLPFFVEDNGRGKFLVRDTLNGIDYYLALKDTIVMLVSDTVAYKPMKFALEEDFLMDTTLVYKVKNLNSGADSGRYLGADIHGDKIYLDTVFAHLPDGQFVVYKENRYTLRSRAGHVTTGHNNPMGDSLSIVSDTLPFLFTNRIDTFEIVPIDYGDMETRKTDPYLGYRYILPEMLDTSAYIFSYSSNDALNRRVMGYEQSDSTMILLTADTAQFVLNVCRTFTDGAPAIAEIPKLERFSYYLRAFDDTTLYASVRSDDSLRLDTIPHQASFFLKEDTIPVTPGVWKYYFVGDNAGTARKLLVDSTKRFSMATIDTVPVHLFEMTHQSRYPAEEDSYFYLTYDSLIKHYSGIGLYEITTYINPPDDNRRLTKNYYNYAVFAKEGESSILRAGSYEPSDFHLWIDTARGPGFNPDKPSFYIVKDVDTTMRDNDPCKISGYFLHVMDSTSLLSYDEYVVGPTEGGIEYNRVNFVKATRHSANELLLESPVMRARDSVGFADKNEDAVNEYRFYLQQIESDIFDEYYIVTEQGYGEGKGGVRGSRGYLSLSQDNGRLFVGPRNSDARRVRISLANRVSNEVVRPVPPPEEIRKDIRIIGGDKQVVIQNAMGERVTVFNVVGQLIAAKTLSSDKETIAVPRGILIVKVGNAKTHKVVVK